MGYLPVKYIWSKVYFCSLNLYRHVILVSKLAQLLSKYLNNVCSDLTTVLSGLSMVLEFIFLALFSCRKKIGHYSSFVCLWQILFNYRLTRFKRFISQFTDKLYNWFWLYLMLYVCAARFDVTKNFEKFLVFGWTKHGHVICVQRLSKCSLAQVRVSSTDSLCPSLCRPTSSRLGNRSFIVLQHPAAAHPDFVWM